MKRDMQRYAETRLAELLRDECKGYEDVSDVLSTIEDLDDNFDGDSYCPYCSEQVDVINAYERDFGSDAEDICNGGQTYKASEWQEAQTAYAYAVAFVAFEHYFSAAKEELKDGIEEFVSDFERELNHECKRVQIAFSSQFGWAAHNRELADGTMIFESRQLDGCNGMEVSINGTWISCCFDPSENTQESESN